MWWRSEERLLIANLKLLIGIADGDFYAAIGSNGGRIDDC